MKSMLTNYLALIFVLFTHIIYAQQRNVTGIISDSNGLPLPGVSVIAKGTTNGVQTDFDGKFSINVEPTQILQFSYIGMKTQEMLANKSVYNIILEDDATELEGVVVTAFGIKRNPKDLGYSVSTVKAEDLTENSEPDLIKSLNGKVAGVNVNVSTGVAGAASQITIRGVNSLNGNTQPLIIVDGVVYSNNEITTSSQVSGGGGYESALSSLDPNDIASVNVLKSASASALYGSRAVNGVIVITTKSGAATSKKGNKLSVNFGTGTYFEEISNLPNYQNKYGAGSNFAYSNSNGSWGAAFGTMETFPTWPSLLESFPDLPTELPYVAKPNNVKDLFRTGIVVDNTLGFNYSGEDGNFNLTISDLDQDGYIPFNTYDRTSISTGGNFKLSNGLTIGATMSYSKTKQVGGFFGENQFDGASSSFSRVLFLARNWDLSYPYEDPATGKSVSPLSAQFDHPMWSWKHDQIITNSYRTVTGFNVSYNFNDNISASYRIGYNKYDMQRKEIRDKGSRADGGVGTITTDNFINEDIESTLLFNFDYKLNDNFGLALILGNNIYQTDAKRIAYRGTELIVPSIYTMKNTNTVSNLMDESSRKRNAGIFADLTLSFKEFFFINGTARNDWSSTLPKNNNSYFYPSVSASLIVSDAFKFESEGFNFWKLRAGYAKVGKDADPEFLSTNFVLGTAYNGNATLYSPNALSNPEIEPEFTTEFEVGTDMEFFNRRIIIDLSLYNKETTNLITPVTVPVTSGYTTLNTNVGAMTNKGVELGLTLVPIKSEDFKWTLFTNYTKNKNEVTKLVDGLERFALNVNEIAYAEVGQPFGVFYGTRFARDSNGNYLINKSTGGILSELTPGIIGNPHPDYKMSFINTFNYKGFSLRAQIDYRKGGDVKSSTIESLLGRGVTKDTEDRERTHIIPGFYANPQTLEVEMVNGQPVPNTIQLSTNELYFSPANSNTFAINSVDEAGIYDGTVIRLRELNLTYDVPKKYLEKTPFGNVSFSIIGSNLWYHAPNVPKHTNFDPDTTSYGGGTLQGIEVSAAPTAKRYGFKLNITF